jgi:tRNA-dihydrouridine synthase
MEYYFAPMQGLTTALYRRVHYEYFPGTNQYYTPFLAAH